jgi:AsmA protein
MKKPVKIVAGVVATLLVLVIAAGVVITLVIDPNDYKDEIVQAVKTRTGRDLKIGGDIKLSLFPWLGVELKTLELSNAPGFGDEPFARVQTVGVKAKLLPLFQKKLDVDKIILNGLVLNLAKNRAGHGNWEGLTGKDKPAAPEEKDAGTGLAGFSIGGVSVRDAELHWEDQASGARYHVRKLALTTGEIAPGKTADVTLGFDLESGQPAVATPVALRMKLAFDSGTQELNVPELNLELAGLALSAKLRGRKMLDAPALDGELYVKPFNLRALLVKLNMPYAAADKDALTQVSLDAPFHFSNGGLALKELKLTLDRSELKGSFELHDFAKPVYRFDLGLNELVLDRYLPAAKAGAPAAPAAAVAPPAPAAAEAPSALRHLAIDGQLRVHALSAFGIKASAVEVTVNARDGVLRLSPLQAKLYDGGYDGAISYDVRPAVPLLTTSQSLTGVQLGPLLKDAGVYDKFSGKANLTAKLGGRGADAAAIKASLNGDATIRIQDGKIEGVDLRKIVNETRALADQLRGKPARVTPKSSDTTEFNQLTATLQVANGVASNNDLLLDGPYLHATGRGMADLGRERLDYALKVTLTEDPAKKGVTVPLQISGPFSALNYQVEWGEVLKEQAEKQLEKQLEKGLRKLIK